MRRVYLRQTTLPRAVEPSKHILIIILTPTLLLSSIQ